jgi:hypothetical protein
MKTLTSVENQNLRNFYAEQLAQLMDKASSLENDPPTLTLDQINQLVHKFRKESTFTPVQPQA